MRPGPAPRPKRLSTVDADLLGLWRDPRGSLFRLTTDGWYYAITEALSYTVSSDGATLTFPTTSPLWQANRVFGSGTSIAGVWARDETAGGVTWTEEVYYRANGSYTGQWFEGGTFDSEWNGVYTDKGSTVDFEERRALVSTSGSGDILFDPPYGSDLSTTYSVDTGAGTWTLHLATGDFVYARP